MRSARSSTRSPRDSPVALAKEYQQFKIIQKDDLTPNVRRIRLALQSRGTKLGLPVGDCVYFKASIDGQDVTRPYTPISSDDDLGYVDFGIKIYPNGKMTQHLDALRVGDSVAMRGPSGSIQYLGAGTFALGRSVPKRTIRHIGLVGGGSGITPLYQVLLAVSKEVLAGAGASAPTVSLIFGNVTEEDIVLRAQLDAFARKCPKHVRVHYTLDRPSAEWTGGRGFITAAMLKEHMPAPAEDTLMLLCGPPPMTAAAERNLQALGHQDGTIRTF
jgi:cytochrome-b5 reductase